MLPMKETVKKIIEFIREHDLLRPGSKVLCALSGGADSVCMTHVLFEHREQLGITVAAAHFNHGIRGEEADRDEAFVHAWCSERGIECVVGRGDVRLFASARHVGLEEAARILRYEFLERTADELSCTCIATAHHLEDNAETLLLRLARGTGSAGLGGIAPMRGRIVHPMLPVSRREIKAYLLEHSLLNVEDSSNASDECARNRLRHHVLPVMEDLNPAFARSCFRTSELLRVDDACLSAMAEEFWQKHFDGSSLPAAELLALPRAISSRVVRLLVPGVLSSEHISAVLALACHTERHRLSLPGTTLLVDQGRLYRAQPEIPELPEIELFPGINIELPEAGLRIRTEISFFSGKIHGLFKPFTLKCDEIYGRLLLTPRRSGDRLRLRGRGCSKTVKKLVTEAGLTQRERTLLPVIRDDKGPLAAFGLAADERGTPSPGDRVLEIWIDCMD